MNAAEDRLAELMEAATRALQPPVEAILAEGERLGRSRQRRRRAAIAAGTAAVLLVAGTGTVAGLRMTRASQYDTAGALAAMHRSSGAPSSTDRASPAPSESASGAGGYSDSAPYWGAASPSPSPSYSAYGPLVPINSTAAVNILEASVPAGWVFGAYKPSDVPGSLLDIDVNDGMGLARVVVGIGTIAKSGMDPIDCRLQAPLLKDYSPRPSGAPPASCDVRRYTNGDLVMQEVLKTDPYGEYQYRIITNRSDGIALEITAANGDSNDPATEVTRTLPPLSVDEWTAIAMQRLWQLRVPASLTK